MLSEVPGWGSLQYTRIQTTYSSNRRTWTHNEPHLVHPCTNEWENWHFNHLSGHNGCNGIIANFLPKSVNSWGRWADERVFKYLRVKNVCVCVCVRPEHPWCPMHQCDIKSAQLSQVPLLVADPPKLSDSFWQFRRELIFKRVEAWWSTLLWYCQYCQY